MTTTDITLDALRASQRQTQLALEDLSVQIAALEELVAQVRGQRAIHEQRLRDFETAIKAILADRAATAA